MRIIGYEHKKSGTRLFIRTYTGYKSHFDIFSGLYLDIIKSNVPKMSMDTYNKLPEWQLDHSMT